MELKELIEKRWQASAEKYSENVQLELARETKRWKEYLRPYVEIQEGMKLLDIGCGPGFFTILLAGEGHETLGIDGSSNMIAQARANAKTQNVPASFQVMDCHHLEFPENTFDLIISRNVVWTLYDPAAAYQEWCRVLKPGGKMLIFDAAWNSEYHDEKVMEKKRQLRAKLKAQDGPEYYCEDQEMGRELDRKSVLGSEKRPQWDMDCLKKMGAKVQVDKSAWEVLWDEKTKLLCGATPMFMIVAEK